ncbi:MAG: porin [Hyphomicrobiaceae bacterium]|nr:porin [Hyphomicrobiaceae bacterium]
MRRHSLGALVAAGLLAGGLSTSASAADLGGNCCADLEERIAELEATTVRKGNRKVSLTISGWVAEQVVFWDDGDESNAYVTGTGTTLSSHFKLTGQATIAPGYQAGYVIHVETQNVDPFAIDQDHDDAALNPSVSVLQSYWFINSDRLGKVSVGQLSHASDNTAILVDGSGSLVPANWLVIEGTSFLTLENGVRNGFTWGDFHHCGHISLGIAADCNGVPWNAVRYDSPTFGGFSVSASWGEDDFWDVAARYAGEFNGIKVAIAAAYSHQSDEAGAVDKRDSDYFQIGAFVTHVPTGLFLYGAYGHENNNNITLDPLDDGIGGEINQPDNDHWYLKAGLRRKFHELGHTVLYGEYGEYSNMISPTVIDALNANVSADSSSRIWGLGVVQEIDAAAMSLWLTYRNIDGSYNIDRGDVTGDLDELHIIKAGALINF